MKKIILASSSPRRKELLKKIVDDFQIKVSTVEEIYPSKISIYQVSRYLAIKKAKDVFKQNKDCIVIGADTTVVINNQILGKPKNKDDVKKMITMLSNNTHLVVSGVCIISKEKMISFSCKTKVTFKKLNENEINEYCMLNNIYDKAGAYAIQEQACKYISKINGDYYNVVGLPICLLNEKLKEFI